MHLRPTFVYSEAEIEVYADDTVIYSHGRSKQQAAIKLTKALGGITTWLNNSGLQLNSSKTVGMFCSK